MKIYVIERDGKIYDNCTLAKTGERVSISAFKTEERALEEARNLWNIFAEKILGKIPYDDIDKFWTIAKWVHVGMDYHNMEIRFTDDRESMLCLVKFSVKELDLND